MTAVEPTAHNRDNVIFHAYGAWRAFLLAFILLTAKTSSARGDSGWEEFTSDLEIQEFTVTGPSFFSSKVLAIRTSLTRFRVGVIRAADFGKTRSDVKTLVEESKAVAGVNANFFDEQGQPLGLVMTRGILRKTVHHGGSLLTGIFQATHDGISILPRSSFSPTSVVEAVQAGPRLIHQGSAVEGLRQSSHSRRAGVCIDERNRFIIFCVSSGLLGLTISQLQDFLLDPRLNCQEALNFDGGGSAQLYLTSHSIAAEESSESRFVEGIDAVPVVLGLFLRD
jgi:exopolysaccharide biosynthesis protein